MRPSWPEIASALVWAAAAASSPAFLAAAISVRRLVSSIVIVFSLIAEIVNLLLAAPITFSRTLA